MPLVVSRFYRFSSLLHEPAANPFCICMYITREREKKKNRFILCCHSESHKEPYYLFDLEILLASHRNVSQCLYLDEAVLYRITPYNTQKMCCIVQKQKKKNEWKISVGEKNGKRRTFCQEECYTQLRA